MTFTIKFSDEQAEFLQTKAAAEGLSVEAWIQKLAEPAPPPSTKSRRPISEMIGEIWRDLPEDARAALPPDGAAQVDHYVYGLPKRDQ